MSEETPNTFDREIASVLEYLDEKDPSSSEYGEAVRNLKTLTESYSVESNANLAWIKQNHQAEMDDRPRPVDPNTIISAVASIAGVGLILQYEKLGVVMSKAFSMIPKIRI